MHIEFIETFKPNGEMTSRLTGDLIQSNRGPSAVYFITVAGGVVLAMSSNGSKAGRRYYIHLDYATSQNHAIAWASRKPRSY